MAAKNCWFPAVLLVVCLHLVGGTPLLLAHSPEMDADDIPMTVNETARSMLLDKDGMIQDGEDMLITQQQYRRLYSGKRERNAGRTVATPWKDGIIPYEIKRGDFYDFQEEQIERAMRTWENVTCVQFRPANRNDRNKLIIHTGDGCSAVLGMKGGTQDMTLSHFCFGIGTVEHEFGHTIGLIHEHQRPERDGYVRVNYFKVKRPNMNNLVKYAKGSDDKMGLPYDYTSVMHYYKRSFSTDTSQTVFTRDPAKENIIGMVLGPSFLDAKLVNLMYNCKSKCGNPPDCPDDCIVNADCQCICEKDFPKERCEDKESKCALLAERGHCEKLTDIMQTNCRQTCGYCRDLSSESGKCEDKKPNCRELAERGECHRDPDTMLKDCKVSCDFCPEDLGKDPTAGPGCVDYDSICQFKADNGLCQKFYAAMITDCPQACGNCNSNITLPADCVDDKSIRCRDKAFNGECTSDPFFMMYICKQSCNNCPGLNVPDECIDYDLRCPDWRRERTCNGAFMKNNCRKTCDTCHIDCMDKIDDCARKAARGECKTDEYSMGFNCKKTCNMC